MGSLKACFVVGAAHLVEGFMNCYWLLAGVSAAVLPAYLLTPGLRQTARNSLARRGAAAGYVFRRWCVLLAGLSVAALMLGGLAFIRFPRASDGTPDAPTGEASRADGLRAQPDLPGALTRKMRLVVADFEATGDAEPLVGRCDAVRQAVESSLAQCHEIELIASDQRQLLVRKLSECREGRTLHDRLTLGRVDDFCGATQGVFGTVKRESRQVMLECVLVELRTAEVLAEAGYPVARTEAIEDASACLADRLLAKLAEAVIISPEDGSVLVGHVTEVAGYCRYRPRSWTLWLVAAPLGSDRSHPQLRVVVRDDGSWLSACVHLGRIGETAEPTPFHLYPLLADPQFTEEIKMHVSGRKTGGLEIAAGATEHYRRFPGPELVRDDT